MLEWQAESGLFTVRIRGKQWYWVYKFELKTVTDIIAAPKNSGRNKWSVFTPGDIQTADDYLHILQLRAQSKWAQKYWKKELVKNNKTDEFKITSPVDKFAYSYNTSYKNFISSSIKTNNSLFLTNSNFLGNYTLSNYQVHLDATDTLVETRLNNKKKPWIFKKGYLSVKTLNTQLPSENFYKLNDLFFFTNRKSCTQPKKSIFLSMKEDPDYLNKIFKQSSDVTEVTRWFKRMSGSIQPVKILKQPISLKTKIEGENLVEVFRSRFTENDSYLMHKPLPNSTFLAMKQKRYKRRRIIFHRARFYWNPKKGSKKIEKFSAFPNLIDNTIIEDSKIDNTRHYSMMKKRRNRSENTSILTSRRLLRTKRTLVLPAHVNLTAVTNSYDVVHSWFIPGLGLKMDCIPGRSTHHTFHIDNVGFYYGQCAEVCGRFHHHMPIRICALPYEHFLVWWNTFGLPKLLFTTPKKDFQTYYGFRKYVW
jgi:heme/copper-type cytochrome/quinol oxidase subunit 2